MHIAIVQPPRLYWAFINDYDNFMVPQAPPALAAVARAAGHQVTVLDCLPMKLGWKSLEARLRELRPDVVAAGENHAVYSHEVVKLMSLAGMLIEMDAPLDVDDVYVMVVRLDETTPMYVAGKVCSQFELAEDRHEIGVLFTEISAGDRMLLRGLLRALSREAQPAASPE